MCGFGWGRGQKGKGKEEGVGLFTWISYKIDVLQVLGIVQRVQSTGFLKSNQMKYTLIYQYLLKSSSECGIRARVGRTFISGWISSS